MGNGQKAAMKREKNAKGGNKEAKSQLKANEAAKNIQCTICRQTFLMTVNEKNLTLHIESKHSGKSLKECFPMWVPPEANLEPKQANMGESSEPSYNPSLGINELALIMGSKTHFLNSIDCVAMRGDPSLVQKMFVEYDAMENCGLHSEKYANIQELYVHVDSVENAIELYEIWKALDMKFPVLKKLDVFCSKFHMRNVAGSLIRGLPRSFVAGFNEDEINRLEKTINIVKDLLKSGKTDLTHVSSHGWNLLHDATFKGLVPIVKSLLASSGFDVNSQASVQDIYPNLAFRDKSHSITALHLAICSSNNAEIKLVTSLLAAGADPNIGSFGEETPLISAIKKKDFKIAKVLMLAGADINLRNPLGYALDVMDFDAISWLLKNGVDTNILDSSGLHPLVTAARKCDFDLIFMLLSYGANVQDINGVKSRNFVVALAHMKCPDVLKYLLFLGLNPNLQDKNGNNILSVALTSSNNEVIKVLLESHARTDILDENGLPPLIIAATECNLLALSLLWKVRADIRQVNKQRSGKVLESLSKSCINAFKNLVAKGLDPNLSDGEGNSLFSVAVKNQDSARVRVLIPALDPRSTDSAIFDAIRMKDPEILKILLYYGGNPNARDHSRRSALEVAYYEGSLELANILYEYGASLDNLPEKDKDTIRLDLEFAEFLSGPLVKLNV